MRQGCEDMAARTMLGVLTLSIGVWLVEPPEAFAQQSVATPQVVQRVVPIFDGFVLRIGNQVVAGSEEEARCYRVEAASGSWLWLRGEPEGPTGWAVTDHVIPVDQAMDYFTDRIRSSPGDAFPFAMRALLWQDKKELDMALGDLNEAIRLDSANRRFYMARGRVWSAKKLYEKAIADFSEAIRRGPHSVTAYILRGDAWYAAKDHDRAIADYSEAIRQDPRCALA
jgi:tetratricopeptide (TPR) repeat protein